MNQKELAYQSAVDGKANSSHNHSASQITSGTLPLTRGGTGVTSLSALKTTLGISDSSSSVRVAEIYWNSPVIDANSYISVNAGFTIKAVILVVNTNTVVILINGGLHTSEVYRIVGTSFRMYNNTGSVNTYQSRYRGVILG